MNNKQIGEMIRTRRLSRGMRQADLADAIGVTASAIGMFERGERRPKDVVAEALADVFNVPKWAIYFSEDEMQDNMKQKMNNDNLWQRREALRCDPKRKVLFDLAENGTDRDVDAAVKLLDALRATNPDFYDGDDPA